MTTTQPLTSVQACRILVVDDSPDDRAEVRRLMLKGSDRRYKFAEAETGAAAVQAVLGAPPGCLVLDYYLPDMTALEVLTAIQGADGLPVCPVVVLTGASEMEYGRLVLRAGAQDYIGKDWLTPPALTRAVENATERWEMGRELRASERRFRFAARAARAMVYELDLRAMRVNSLHGLDELLGYRADEAEPTLAWWDGRIHPEDLPRCHAAFRAIRTAPRDQAIEYRVRHKDGRTLWVEDRVTPVRDRAGELVQLVGTVVDVTDGRLAEESLRVSEGRLKEAQRIARIGSWTWEPPSGRVWWSEAIYELFGLVRDDVKPCYEAFLSVVHPDDRPVAVRRVEAVLAGADGFADDLRIIAPDGRQIWIHSQARANRGPDGQLRLVEGTDQDITARKVGEAALQASEERLRLALRASATGLWTWDVRTDAVTWSPECYPIHGMTEAAFEGTGVAFFRLVHPDDRERVESAVRAAVAEQRAYECEFRIVRPTGEIVWVANRARANYGADGRPRQVLGTVTDISARKSAEAGLARTEMFARSVVESSADCIKGLALDGRLLWINAPAQRQMQIQDFAALKGRNWPALWEPFGLRDEAEAAVAAARSGGTGRFRGYRPTMAGTPRWWDVVITPIESPEGVDQLLVVCRDITDAHAVENRLRTRERELQALADNTPDLLTRFDRDLRHVFVNVAVEKATGRKKEALLGKTVREFGLPAELCDRWEAAVRGVFERSEPTSFGFTFDTHAGPRYFVSRLVPETDAGGRVEFVLGVTHDVTQQNRAEAALRTSEERLARAQKAAGVGTWDWDIVAGAAAWTDEAWELFGPATRPESVTYDFWLACVHPEDRERAAAAVAAALAGDSYHDEFRVCRHDGSVLWLESGGALVRSADGRPVRLLGTVRDVTERKRAEVALQDADRRKDEFLATLAHELRNPLAPIQNGLQVVRLGGVPERAEKTIAMMERQLGHMIELIDDLLDVSRVRTGKITLRLERVTVRYIVESAVEACQPTIDAKGHALEFDLPTDPLALDGDRTRLVQVVANLLTNAAKYSERGGRIRVAAVRDGAWVVVRVSDTGVGIAPELLPTLWDMFTQVRDTLDKAQGGLGIGLSLVKKLVEMHGGTATAESDGVGKGSTFALRLPLAEPGARAPKAAGTGEPNESPPSAQVGQSVLVVDDNEDAAESLAELLQIFGHTTHTAHNGPGAIAAVYEFRPDVVFLDLGLPGIDGYEVTRRLRADADLAGVVIVALTGWGSEDDKRKTEDVGFDFHLTKPVERDQVTALLAKVSPGRPRGKM